MARAARCVCASGWFYVSGIKGLVRAIDSLDAAGRRRVLRSIEGEPDR